MKNIQNRLLLLFVIVFLLSVPIYWSLNSGGFSTNSVIEGRILNTFPKLGYVEFKRTIWLTLRGRFEEAQDVFLTGLFDQSIQPQFLNASLDQFPFRIALIRLAKGSDRLLINTTYAILPDKAVPLDSKSKIYITKDGRTVIKDLLFFNESTKERLDHRIDNYEEIASKYPDKIFYVFYIEKLAYSKFDPRLPVYQDLDGGQSFDYFENHLPKNITLGMLGLSSIEDFNNYFYHTDHHWNIRGAWKAYQNIYEMVSKNYPGISPVNDSIQYIKYPNLTCLGTYARDTLYPFKPEPFEIATVSLPDFYILKRDYKITYNQNDNYNRGIFSTDPYVSHYEKYFGANDGFLTYRFNNNATKNLLLIGTSYKIPIQPWIASHYQTSYFVNPVKIEDFSMEKFLKEHKVDDIIILTTMDELLNLEDAINP